MNPARLAHGTKSQGIDSNSPANISHRKIPVTLSRHPSKCIELCQSRPFILIPRANARIVGKPEAIQKRGCGRSSHSRKLCPNNLCHLRGSPQRCENNLRTKPARYHAVSSRSTQIEARRISYIAFLELTVGYEVILTVRYLGGQALARRTGIEDKGNDKAKQLPSVSALTL